MSQDTEPKVDAGPEATTAEVPAAKPKPGAKPTAARTAIRRTAKRSAPAARTESTRPYDADYRSGHRVWPD
ncbi:hypothetical protein [Allochromatium palmeri]|uniref:Uncharacterized protein n=1 Tax=Allochromatium palmeri TaxID=231048 RepID=A0A6N8EEN8_9GAMM|nr:hypothetical protein [Allochromatium palmeri]MTW22695.1 hypothetical protein [Allochromatium palmeri]